MSGKSKNLKTQKVENSKVESLSQQIYAMLNDESYSEAKKLLTSELETNEFDTSGDLMYLAEIAGLFIDLGNESYDEECLQAGLDIFEKNKELFKGVITESSIDYCIANGKHAFYKIYLRDNPGTPSPKVVKKYLAESKNFYYKAYKSLNLADLNNFGLQVLTNLGNDLNHAGRAIEAIQLFDTVLQQTPDFPQALGSKADALRFWMQTSQCPHNIALYSTIYHNFKESLKYKYTPPEIRRMNEQWLQRMKELIVSEGFSIDKIEEEFAESLKEKEAHSPYRQFCLDNFLTLSEHAVYCPCRAAAVDNLMIGYDGVVAKGKKIPKMELILNRIKSEYSLARKLFYESDIELEEPVEDEAVFYSDLFEDEVIGLASEKLRTSFRLCFGIFDRIAHGLCYFFDLKQSSNENIYFEKFWYNPNNTARWEKINELSNIGVTALYSIACDLNDKNGEFGKYKDWRNWLEHEIMILRGNNNEIDILKVLEDYTLIKSFSIVEFKKNALHLLQLCRAAIFSFTYAIRQDSIHSEIPDNTLSIEIAPK